MNGTFYIVMLSVVMVSVVILRVVAPKIPSEMDLSSFPTFFGLSAPVAFTLNIVTIAN
jgi:hypothetical protein